MKVKDLFENVVKIDFAQAHAKRQQQAIDNKRRQDLDKATEKVQTHDERETQTVQELAEFEEWMVTAKKKGRVPGFETMDDVIYYLIHDVELPNHITRHKAIDWFSSISEDDREKVRMVAHHADRLIQIYDVLRSKVHTLQDMWSKKFGGKVPRGWDAIEGAAWLDSEFTYDIAQLKNLKKAITILGQ